MRYLGITLIFLFISCTKRPDIIRHFEKEMEIKMPNNIQIIKANGFNCEFEFDEMTEKHLIQNIHKSKLFDSINSFEIKIRGFSSNNNSKGELVKGCWARNRNGYAFFKSNVKNRQITDYLSIIDTIKNTGTLQIEKSD